MNKGIRELVTVLRYQVDNSGLKQYKDAYQNAARGVAAGQRKIASAVRIPRRGLRSSAGRATGAGVGIPAGALPVPGMPAGTGAAAGAREHRQQAEGVAGAYRSAVGYLKQMVLAYGVLSTARIADEWASVEARVGLATDSIEDQKTALEGIFKIAQDTRQEYASAGDLFAKISRNRKTTGMSTDQNLALTRTIGQALTIGGGSVESQQAALMQLGQSIAKGRVDGEELNSILEQAPRLAEAIAASFNVGVGDLKEMGAQGKLLTSILLPGLLKQSELLEKEFAKLPRTFGGAMLKLKNEIGRRIHDLNKLTGAAQKFADAIEFVIKHLSTILKLLGLIAARWAFGRLMKMALPLLASFTKLWAGLGRSTGSAWKSLAVLAGRMLMPWIRMAAIMEGVYLIGQDIYVWLKGGDSVTGDILGSFSEWEGSINRIRDGLIWVKDQLGGIGQELGPWLVDILSILSVVYAIGKGLALISGPVTTIIGWVMKLGSVFMWLGGIIATGVTALAAFLGAPVLLVAALIAALVGLGVYLYNYWDEFSDYWTGMIKRMANVVADLVPDWIKRGFGGGSADNGLANKFGVGAGDVQRAGASGSWSQQTTVGDIYVTAPNSNPTAIAAATSKGIKQGLSGPRLPLPTPMVEAAP
ncbi:MAG TPA: tape measure protein [Pseudolabrys sp.]|jgi:tape measure domain-containing protein|nr:tape measure protein [Pseudolabrys sp.]